jgi:hypothetical protein
MIRGQGPPSRSYTADPCEQGVEYQINVRLTIRRF